MNYFSKEPIKPPFIDYDYECIKEKLNDKYKGIEEAQFKRMIPLTHNRKILKKFYEDTGVTIFYNYITDERSLIFNRCGVYPDYDEGWGRYLPASGLYFEVDGNIKLECDVFIEQRVQYIGVTQDNKNYVIIPQEVSSEEIFEVNDEYEDLPEIEESSMYKMDLSLEKFHRFYIPVDDQ